MAINVNFNGATIYKPGSYSKTTIDLGGSFPIGPAGIVAIFGEADRGKPGSLDLIQNNVYRGNQFAQIRAKYGSGPIVDAAQFLLSPASDAAIPNGAQAIYIYKTNASTAASYGLEQAAASWATIRAQEWGIGGNRVSYKNILTSEVAPVITGTVISIGDGTALNGVTFDVSINGTAAATITLGSTEGDHDTIGELVIELNQLFVAASVGIVASAGSGDNLILTYTARTNPQSFGYSAAVELIETETGDLALLGLEAGVTLSSVESAATISLNNKRDLIIESDTLGGNIVVNFAYDGDTGSSTAATVTIDDDSIILLENAAAVATFSKSSYTTLADIVADMNMVDNWTVTLETALYGQLSPDVLDQISAVGAFSASGAAGVLNVKKDAYEIVEFFDLSGIVEINGDDPVTGLPDARAEIMLSGGTLGATSSASITNALTEFTKIRANAIVPLFSRDATDDIADSLTDSSSAYTIAAVHQAVKTHISLMGTTTRRSERQGYISIKDTWDNCKLQSQTLADGRLQLVTQDIRQIDSQGTIKWFQPWAFACLVAGSRMGAPFSVPLTFKYMNCSGIRHTAQPMSTAEEDIVIDFDPNTQSDEAIQYGITFMEAAQTGGFRIVVDNTTYGKDGNFVWNRGSVIYAADAVAYEFRNQLENIYVGKKNNVSTTEIKDTASSILTQFVSNGTIVSFNSLNVSISGSTINIGVTLVMIEGIEFILNDITITRNQG